MLRPFLISHVAIFAIIGFGLFTVVAHAQSDSTEVVPSIGRDVVIAMSPRHPSPGERVRFSLSSNLLNLEYTNIVWKQNGKEIGGGTGMVEFEINTGALGVKQIISADVSDKNLNAHAEAVIIPTQVDLLYDADSYIPPFYKGRALPSAGSRIRMQAIAQFKRADGTLVPESGIAYTWKQNDRIMNAVSGRGKSSATFDAPSLFGAHTIVVSAVSSDGTFSGETSVVIPSVDPIVLLYEDDPLFGVMYHHALANNAVIGDSERAFIGVPHFAPIRTLSDTQISYEWRINNRKVVADPKKQSTLTINADNSSGSARIDVGITHRKNLSLDARGTWNLSFRILNAPTGLLNPFGEVAQ